jgi:hypothetical protein
MLRILFVLALGLVSARGFAQTLELTTPEEVPRKVGQTVRVQCTIVDVVYREYTTGKPTFLDQNRDWRKNPFAITIFESTLKNGFSNDLDLVYLGKTVEIIGVVEKFRVEDKQTGRVDEKIGFKLTTPSQITIIN